MTYSSKFLSNDERFAHLKALWSGTSADHARAFRLAWELVKTGVFDKRDFERCMVVYASARGDK